MGRPMADQGADGHTRQPTRMLTVRLEPDLDLAVRRSARATGRGLSDFVRGALALAVHPDVLDPCGCFGHGQDPAGDR